MAKWHYNEIRIAADDCCGIIYVSYKVKQTSKRYNIFISDCRQVYKADCKPHFVFFASAPSEFERMTELQNEPPDRCAPPVLN